MNTKSNAVSGSLESNRIAPAAMSTTHPMYWSIQREFWENRYLYVAPLAVAAVFLFGFLISVVHAPARIGEMLALDSMHSHEEASRPFDIAAGVMMATLILTNLFYCADALHSERRDRSILFWKLLPVSDLTTVLAKASIPLLILPLLISVITLVLQFLMLLLSSAVTLAIGGSVSALWSQLPLFRMWLLMLYHLLTAHSLWPAPVYFWLLLVSGWARRATMLWAALPIVAIAGVEKLAFHTAHFATMVGTRFIGDTASVATATPDVWPTDPMMRITPGTFLSTPGLWIGLVVAAAFLLAAVRLRRYQGPV